MKKLICLIMAVITVFACFGVTASAKESARILELAEKFEDGIGPEVNGIKIDYVSYTPEKLARGEISARHPASRHGPGRRKARADCQ